MVNKARAIEAAQRLGGAELAGLISECLRPLTLAEQQQWATARAAAKRVADRKAALDTTWKNMSFAEYAERKAAGTLPPTK